MTLGAGRYSATPGATSGAWVNSWLGAIDDVHVFQGALSSVAVHQIFVSES